MHLDLRLGVVTHRASDQLVAADWLIVSRAFGSISVIGQNVFVSRRGLNAKISSVHKSVCEDMMSSQLCMHNSRYTQLFKTHSHAHTHSLCEKTLDINFFQEDYKNNTGEENVPMFV